MRIFIFFYCLTIFSFVPEKGYAQNANIKIESDRVISVKEVFELIKTQTNYRFIYPSNLFDEFSPVTVKKGTIRVKSLLEQSLSQGDFSILLGKRKTIIIRPKSEELQTIIKGHIVDETGQPLPGVNVILKGSKKGTSTDFDGNYQIALSNVDENSVLVFSYVGYQKQEITIGTKTTIDLMMKPNLSSLDEVVVIGYGTSKIKDATGVISRVSAKEIQDAPMGSSVESLLQGKAVGVSVQIQSASPTSPISVIIRGASSLTGDNQPLWVIDGVPQYSNTTSGDIANTLYNLNINDVESIDILKDASATAVYGSRASNGVIIVTTKKGKPNMRPLFEVSSRTGLTVRDYNGYEYFETDQYKEFTIAAAKESIISGESFDSYVETVLDKEAYEGLRTSEFDKDDLQVLPDAFYDGNINWLDEFTQNPIVQQYNLSVRGGSKENTYFMSFNYSDTEGVIKGGRSELYGGRINYDTKINDNINFGISLSGSSRNSDNKDGLLSVIKNIRPDIPAYNPDGTLFTKDVYTENPYTTLKNSDIGKGITFNGTAFLEIQLLKGLKFKSSFTNNFTDAQYTNYDRLGTSNNNVFNTRAWSSTKTSFNVFENTLSYAKNINKKHDITALAGYSMEGRTRNYYSIRGENFPDDDILNNFGSAADITDVDETKTKNTLISQFARLHYKFNDRYIVSGTIRRDGSSRFGADKRWGIFPSGAAAWLISEENFMKSDLIQKYVSYLKLRSSLGVTGSQNLGDFDWVTLIYSAIYDDNPAFQPATMGNPDLRWEQTEMFDLGLDFGFLDSRIYGSVGIYEKNSKDILYNKPVAPSSSFSSVKSNIATLTNKGFELDFKYDILRTPDQRLTFDFNYFNNITKVTKFNGRLKELFFPGSYAPYIRLVEGGEIGQWYGLETAGRFYVSPEDAYTMRNSSTSTGQTTYYNTATETMGDLIFIDQDGDGKITNDDRVNIGSSSPKGAGGFGLTYMYKGFRINTTFSYAYGHKRFWNLPYSDVGATRNYNQSNLIAGQSTILKSPYEANYPRLAVGYNSRFSDFYLHDASYVRLNALNISYKLPSKLFKNSQIKGIDLTLQGTNLLTITKYPGFDPQGNWSSSSIGSGMSTDSSRYPSAQVYSFGIKFNIQ
ncbi:TonB-dependent receptor [Flavobacteriaceae bacterium F08102]|nr:TonB-dependent receptor [Flavobacteriaceae bacterium F08102]